MSNIDRTYHPERVTAAAAGAVTVADLIAALQQLPPETPLVGITHGDAKRLEWGLYEYYRVYTLAELPFTYAPDPGALFVDEQSDWDHAIARGALPLNNWDLIGRLEDIA